MKYGCKSKVKGAKHYASKQTPHFEKGGKVGAPKVSPNPQAMGRAKQGQKLQSEANQRMVDALQTGNYVRAGAGADGSKGPAPAGYGNLRKSNDAPVRAKDGAAALREKAYGNYKPMSAAEPAIRADRKQAKEGRR